jgi:hypothetical protein
MPGRHGHATPQESQKLACSAHFASHARRASAPASVATLLCLVSLCVLATGCGANAVTAMPHRTPVVTISPFATSTPTVPPVTTPAVKAPLSWHISTLPDGATQWFPVSVLAVAPSNGDVAYLCDGSQRPNTSSSARFYATHDHGAHWQRMTDIPASEPCNPLVVDEADPNTVFAGLLSTDGGVTWQQRTSASQPHGIFALATWHSLRYAIVGVPITNGITTTVAVSSDNMQTWRTIDLQQIDSAATPSRDSVGQLWVHPTTGAVLVTLRGYVWESQDTGQHWSRFPGQRFPGSRFAAQVPRAGQSWHICADFTSYDGAVPLSCTDDGQSWHDQSIPASYTEIMAIDADGSLIVKAGQSVFRLPAGTSQWRALGNLPSFCDGSFGFATFAPSSSGGWWAFPAGGQGACNQFATAPVNRS